MLRTAVTLAIFLSAGAACPASLVDSLKAGKSNLQSAGALAFGPEGILFVADPKGASVFAFDTGDHKTAKAPAVELKAVNEKIAALLGSTPDQILVNDLAVNPASHQTYLSVSRGRGPDGTPVLVRVDSSGAVTEFRVDGVRFSSISLPNAPAVDAKDARGQSKRQEAITGIAWVDGRLLVAGLSNEEFSSNLRSIPFPFHEAGQGSNVEIYHGSHGRFETNSPVRTFVPYQIKGEPYVLAAYTCTPLVKIPVSALKPGAKVMGTTIAELGNRNRPLDMVPYSKGGKDYILMNNSSRGVMKVSADKLDSYPGITEQTEVKGVPYETISQFKGVEQLARYDDARALMLIRGEGGSLDLRTVDLP